MNAKSSGSDIEGLGFAIPVNTAKTVIEQIISYGYVQGRIDLGIPWHAIWIIPFTFVSSWLATRYSKKSVLTVDLFLYIIGGVSGAFATDIWFLLVHVHYLELRLV